MVMRDGVVEYYDVLETRGVEVREAALFSALPLFIENSLAACAGLKAHLGGIDVRGIGSRSDLARLPILRKSDLPALQAGSAPFGGFADESNSVRFFSSPGGLFEPQGMGDDPWRCGRAVFAAGMRLGDVVLNTFSYHMTPGGFIMDSGARAVGCRVIPAGPGNKEAQLGLMRQYRPTGYLGTPDFLKILVDAYESAYESAGFGESSFVRGLVSGAALPGSLRRALADRGIVVFQCYAIAEVGLIAYETATADGICDGMVVGEDIIVEIVDPATGVAVAEGEIGEVVVTCLQAHYPMIRLATGDLSRILTGVSPCGRTNMRLAGWLGRADQTTKVKGMFVHPSQLGVLGSHFPELGYMVLVVDRENEQDVMTVRAECADESLRSSEAFVHRMSGSIRDIFKLGGLVELVAPDTLPRDGKVILDKRKNM